MHERLKVQSHHLERGAYLYSRQSSMRQVMKNVESTKRQYDLRGRAIGLGWHDDQISIRSPKGGTDHPPRVASPSKCGKIKNLRASPDAYICHKGMSEQVCPRGPVLVSSRPFFATVQRGLGTVRGKRAEHKGIRLPVCAECVSQSLAKSDGTGYNAPIACDAGTDFHG